MNLFYVIFIDTNDTYLNVRINNKKCKFRLKIFHFYQYYDSKNKLFINEIKLVILIRYNEFETNNKDWMQKHIHDIIQNNYGDIAKYCIFLISHGTRDLKLIAQSLNVIHQIDKYHQLNRICVTFRSKQLKLIQCILNNQTKQNSEIISLCKPMMQLIKTMLNKDFMNLVK